MHRTTNRLRVGAAAAVFAVSFACCGALCAEVVVSEIAYNPAPGEAYEFVELHNTGDSPVSLGGWKLQGGITFEFPEDTEISAGGTLVVARSRASLLALFKELDPGTVAGDFQGRLADEGDTIELVDALGRVRERVEYDDEAPWEFLADGYGATLERICPEAPAALPENWRASPVPEHPAFPFGSPGTAGPFTCPPPGKPAPPRVLLSEIHYHPVLEESLEEDHEFIEIHNAGGEAVDLGGWRLAGGIGYRFPEGTAIAPGAYLVVAADPEKLAAVARYGLEAGDLLGGYERRLDNGGERIALIDRDGRGVDGVRYDDGFPWPVAADALGAGESWLPGELLPLEDHRYLGRSLERVSFDFPAKEAWNWDVSPLDGPTPGKPNASARPEPLPIVVEIEVAGADTADPAIRDSEPVAILARFEPAAPAGTVELEWFIEDVTREDEPVERVTMAPAEPTDGGEGHWYRADLPGFPENSIVRYRIRADRGAGMELVSPRPSHPHPWHAYFVSPVVETRTRLYHLFISPVAWGRMWTNIQGGRVRGCAPSPTWNAKVPAIFVHEGKVFDAHVRYQGSRWNRANGRNLSGWRYPRPSTGPLLALSWRISLPRYARLEGRSVIILNKLTQSCPGYNSGVGYRLFAEAGVPAPLTRYVRFHVNGGYYHYMMEYERPGEEMMRRYHREETPPGAVPEKVGHLYKSAGCNCDEGPYGWGDERLLAPFCGHSAEVRYRYTYDRKTHEWDDYDEFIRLIEDLHAARRAGREALRAYFAERFDLDLLLNYLAIINWSVPFDDMFQNHFLYQRLSDGKWIITPWDLDRNFGEWRGATSSIFVGEAGNPDNRSGWWNYLKDAFFKSYREEFTDRLLLLNNTLLHPDHVSELVDLVAAEADPAEAARAPAGVACSFTGRIASFKTFARQRHAFINQQIAGVRVDAGPDMTVIAGTVVQFDARASTPDPGPDVTYEWDNGMTGDYPTFVFEEPGVYEITLTVTFRGIPFQDSVIVTVLPVPEKAFREDGGLVVMEAENPWMNDPRGDEVSFWVEDSIREGFSGRGYMNAHTERRRTFLRNYANSAPELRYAILFETAGAYRVWVRGFADATANDSVWVGLDGVEVGSSEAHQFQADLENWTWSGDTRRAGPQLVEVARPGLHYLSLWIRETGIQIDKILLTLDHDFTPEGFGPPESALVPVGGAGTFVRGDANGNGRIEVTDAVKILFRLFRGASLDCADAGDTDDDGALTLTDAVALLDFLFRGGPAPPPPFPDPGPDPTEDDLGCERGAGGRP